MIPALVLTAGLATRLRPLSLVRAKAVLPLGGRPLVAHVLERLASAGVPGAVLNLHHLPATVARRIGDGSEFGLPVRYSWEFPKVLGSAGGPRKALALLGTGRFLIVNGDTLTDLDVRALVDAHAQSGALVTMAVVRNPAPHKYSGLSAGADGRFTGLVARGSADPSWHFIGVQVVEAEAFSSLPEDVPAESILSLYPQLERDHPGSVRVHPCGASFLDIGTPADYMASCRRMAKAPDLLERGTGSRIAKGARVTDTIVWDDVTIGEGASVAGCILTDSVTVPAGARWNAVMVRRDDGHPIAGEERVSQMLVSPVPA